jgi:hypothetical protein
VQLERKPLKSTPRQLLQSKAFNCASVFLSSNANRSPAPRRQYTVLPISASLYSKPSGNRMRALCSSPLTGFLIGSLNCGIAGTDSSWK